MKNNGDKTSIINELKRKSIHLSSVIVPLSYYFFSRDVMLIALAVIFFNMVLLDILRYRNDFIKKFYNKFFKDILRVHESDENKIYFTGGTYIVLAFLLCVFLFEMNIAILSMFIIIFCDTAAAIVGKLFGKHYIKNKTIEGSLAFFIVGMILFFFTMKPDNVSGLLIGTIAVFITTLFELIPLKIDDNIVIPMFFGITYSLLTKTDFLI